MPVNIEWWKSMRIYPEDQVHMHYNIEKIDRFNMLCSFIFELYSLITHRHFNLLIALFQLCYLSMFCTFPMPPPETFWTKFLKIFNYSMFLISTLIWCHGVNFHFWTVDMITCPEHNFGNLEEFCLVPFLLWGKRVWTSGNWLALDIR